MSRLVHPIGCVNQSELIWDGLGILENQLL